MWKFLEDVKRLWWISDTKKDDSVIGSGLVKGSRYGWWQPQYTGSDTLLFHEVLKVELKNYGTYWY